MTFSYNSPFTMYKSNYNTKHIAYLYIQYIDLQVNNNIFTKVLQAINTKLKNNIEKNKKSAYIASKFIFFNF